MAEAASAGSMGFHLHHTMLPVADMDRSLDFYTSLLGMRVESRHSNPARHAEVALIGYGTSAGHLLELTRTIAEKQEPVQPLNTHVAIHVNDLRALCDLLETRNVTFVRPFKARNDGRGFTAWVADPDRNPIELVEMH